MKPKQQNQESLISLSGKQGYYLPHFLGLGSQRCASSWLYQNLNLHPKIIMTSKKETRYFSHKITSASLEWYSNLFLKNLEQENSIIDDTFILGEIDPSYAAMYYQEILQIKQIIPNLKIILIIRNPVERMISSITRGWTFSYMESEEAKNTNIFYLLRSVDSSLPYRFTDYERTYKNWSSVFGEENIFIDTYERIKFDPEGLLDDLLYFLQVNKNTQVIENAINKKNVSKPEEKEDIPHLLRWYLSRKWLPKVRRLQSQLNLDLSSWIESMEKNASEGKWYYYLIILIHYIYFMIPYTFAYKLYNAIRIPLKIRQIQKNLHSQIGTS